ncbi:MAG: glycosyltransferase family 4 protein [Pseudomonadota bacterium]
MIAVYAPLKSPNHPVPSGDRTMGRALMAALYTAGVEPRLVSELRLYDKDGQREMQDALMNSAKDEIARLLTHPDSGQWRAWLTYHNYYKAPDLIGPAVCSALHIPYLQVESTRARKRLTGPWAPFAEAAEAASDAAAVIFHLTARDGAALHAYAPPGQRIEHLPPFLNRSALPQPAACDGPMLAVGMLRPGDKLASYTLIAEVLHLLDGEWRLDIIGSGAAQAEVAALMAPFGSRVRMLGRVEPDEMDAHYARAGLLLWPGVNEAFGLSYLEAQAHGLPVVAQDRPGVRDVVAAELVPEPLGAAGLARRVQDLLSDPEMRHNAGAVGREAVAARHLRPAAGRQLTAAIDRVCP